MEAWPQVGPEVLLDGGGGGGGWRWLGGLCRIAWWEGRVRGRSRGL